MDLLEYVEAQFKKGKKPAEVRKLLVENGYPVYEIENALAISEDDEKPSRKISININAINLKNAPGYMIIFALSGILIIIGIITLFFYAK